MLEIGWGPKQGSSKRYGELERVINDIKEVENIGIDWFERREDKESRMTLRNPFGVNGMVG